MPQPKRYVSQAERQRAYRQRRKRNGNVTLQQQSMAWNRTILSLYDASGVWSKPYRDAGYNVIQVDLKYGDDVRLLKPLDLPAIYGVLAAPPCTDFASSGAWKWDEKGDGVLVEALSMVDAVYRIVSLKRPAWWVLENPVGRLVHYIGQPVMKFNPCDFGDPYTKTTLLWGEFNSNLRLNEVYPELGSYIHDKLSSAQKERRSITPEGFAYAFFLANP